jgi:hypothetical protein
MTIGSRTLTGVYRNRFLLDQLLFSLVLSRRTVERPRQGDQRPAHRYRETRALRRARHQSCDNEI